MSTAVSVRRLKKTYSGDVEAVKGIDFDVYSGEVFGLLGPDGAGKSTTIGMLTTTVLPTSGTASLGGYDVVSQPLQARAMSSVVFQEAVVDKGLTGRSNLQLHADLWGVPRAGRPIASRSSSRSSGSTRSSTALSAVSAAASVAGSRSRARSCPSPT